MQFPIHVGLHRSRFLDTVALLMHGCAMIALLAVPWPLPVKLAMLASCMASLILTWFALRPPFDLCTLFSDGSLECRDHHSGELESVKLLNDAIAHHWLTVFRIELASGKKVSVLVGPGSTDTETFRRLRIWLRWRAEFNGAGDVS